MRVLMRAVAGALGAAVVAAPAAVAQRTTLTGVVVDSATKQPVNGAVVEIASASKRFAIRTDEAGEFIIYDVDLGPYRAVIRRIGYAPSVREVDVVSGMRPLSFGIAPIPQDLREVRVRGEGSGIFGQIGTSDALKAIPGAVIYVAGTRDSVVTDSVGSYFMPVKRPGMYMVRVNAPGFIEDLFMVDVKRNAISDGSRLLDAGQSRPMRAMLWKDFDQRVSFRTVNAAALLTGAEVRRAGNNVTGALAQSGAIVSTGMRLGPGVCVFVDGQPRPGYPVNGIRPEEIRAMEIYASGSDAARLAMTDWPRNMRCSDTGERPLRGAKPIGVLVIWTR